MRAVIKQVECLKGTENKDLILKPNQMKSLECYVDSDFCGNWNKMMAQHDVRTSESRTGYLISLHGAPSFKHRLNYPPLKRNTLHYQLQ